MGGKGSCKGIGLYLSFYRSAGRAAPIFCPDIQFFFDRIEEPFSGGIQHIQAALKIIPAPVKVIEFPVISRIIQEISPVIKTVSSCSMVLHLPYISIPVIGIEYGNSTGVVSCPSSQCVATIPTGIIHHCPIC